MNYTSSLIMYTLVSLGNVMKNRQMEGENGLEWKAIDATIFLCQKTAKWSLSNIRNIFVPYEGKKVSWKSMMGGHEST